VAIRTWVGRFSIVQGRVEEEGPWLGSFVRQRPDEESDELYAIVEPALPGSEEFCGQLVEVIGKLYRRDTLSLTGAVLRAVRAAHDQLKEWNRRSLRQHRVAAGISCLAVRDQTAYLAQAGPSLAYLRRNDGAFQRIEPDETDPTEALGLADDFYPQLSRYRLEPGDQLVIASTNLDELADEETVASILAMGADQALPQLYLLARSLQDFSLILLTAFEQPDAGAAGMPQRRGVEGESESEPAGGTRATAAVGSPETAPSAASLASLPAAEPLAAEPSAPVSQRTNGFAQEVADLAEASVPLDVTRPVVRLKGHGSAVSYRRSTTAFGVPRPRVPRVLLIALPVLAALVLLGWCVLVPSVRESREDRFNGLVTDARQLYEAARVQPDAGQKRSLLQQAEDRLASAEKIHQNDAQVQALKADVEAGITELNAVSDLRDLTEVVNLPTRVSGDLSVTRMVVGGGSLYLLDTRGRRVLAVPPDGGDPVTVLEDGALAGFVRVGKPVQMTWAGAIKALLIMDDQRQLYAYVPGKDPLPLTVRGAQEWGSVDGIAFSGGNLYVLDVRGGAVWRYLPTDTGFDSERSAVITTDLTGASELAVGHDVYVLMRDGRVRRFAGGQEQPFELAGIDRPLLTPASLDLLPGSGRVALADRGNKRIVLATADGAFQRQLVSNTITDLRAVGADEAAGVIYILVRDTIYRAALPAG